MLEIPITIFDFRIARCNEPYTILPESIDLAMHTIYKCIPTGCSGPVGRYSTFFTALRPPVPKKFLIDSPDFENLYLTYESKHRITSSVIS